MSSILGKLICTLLVFPPLYIVARFVKWSWRSFQKEMEDQSDL